jgi:hypothetical protein
LNFYEKKGTRFLVFGAKYENNWENWKFKFGLKNESLQIDSNEDRVRSYIYEIITKVGIVGLSIDQ